MLNPLRRALLVLVLFAIVPGAQSIEVESLYTVQVVLDPEDPDARSNAYRTALTQVLVRVTGSVEAATSEEMLEIFPIPTRYVLEFRPGENESLWVSLDGPAIETMLRRTGQTIWSNDRPLTLIWLAVDWGQGEREIVAADDPERVTAARSIDRNRLLRERVLEVAEHRGVPVLFPLLDTEDLESLSFSDIWGGFDDRLLQASARYGANSILVGRIRPGDYQDNRWTFYLGDERYQWGGEPEEAVNLLADALAARFAFAGDAPVEVVTLTISGIDSVVAYGAVQRFMQELRQVEDFVLDTVAGDRIRYRVQIQGGIDRLRRALELSDFLVPTADDVDGTDAGAMTDFNALNFVYIP